MRYRDRALGIRPFLSSKRKYSSSARELVHEVKNNCYKDRKPNCFQRCGRTIQESEEVRNYKSSSNRAYVLEYETSPAQLLPNSGFWSFEPLNISTWIRFNGGMSRSLGSLGRPIQIVFGRRVSDLSKAFDGNGSTRTVRHLLRVLPRDECKKARLITEGLTNAPVKTSASEPYASNSFIVAES
ncbi:hypothetical protein PM082_024386 [Marasmius tenuissimus]|nr:hypothetical protein PM082_024386 [Marasmius tenuissimus]